MALPATVPDSGLVLDLDALRASAAWSHGFPSRMMVDAAASLLTPFPSWRGDEGSRPRLIIGPGVLAVSEVNPARAERTADRARESAWKGAALAGTDLLVPERLASAEDLLAQANGLASAGLADWSALDAPGRLVDHFAERAGHIEARKDREPERRIRSWSRKSRARMVRRLAELDYAPLFASGGVPAMLTLTYPGEWEVVAPSAAVCAGHLKALSKRFKRAWGVPLVGVWKREFQRRGAPHYHLLMVPPTGTVNGERFREWVGRAWSEVVAHPDPQQREWHRAAGTGVDYAEGMRARDPKRLAVYFSKHGAYAAKEYQNSAPDAWEGSVGRFWGVWGLESAARVVEVSHVEAIAAARTMRRWQRANGYRVQREVVRVSRTVDADTGELLREKVRRRRSGVWSGSRMRGRLGFVVVNDGAAFASALARHLDAVREDAQAREVATWLASPVRLRSVAARLDG